MCRWPDQLWLEVREGLGAGRIPVLLCETTTGHLNEPL